MLKSDWFLNTSIIRIRSRRKKLAQRSRENSSICRLSNMRPEVPQIRSQLKQEKKFGERLQFSHLH